MLAGRTIMTDANADPSSKWKNKKPFYAEYILLNLGGGALENYIKNQRHVTPVTAKTKK